MLFENKNWIKISLLSAVPSLTLLSLAACSTTNIANTAASLETNDLRSVKFTSNPEGAVIIVRDAERLPPLKSCTTPCTLELDASLRYVAYGETMGGETAELPLGFPREKGIGVHVIYERGNPGASILSLLNVGTDFSVPKFEMPINEKPEMLKAGFPNVPPLAKRSGHCLMIHDVTPAGFPTNIKTKSCTDNIFRNSSIVSTMQTRYAPQTQNGAPAFLVNATRKVSFKLVDKRGNVVPE